MKNIRNHSFPVGDTPDPLIDDHITYNARRLSEAVEQFLNIVLLNTGTVTQRSNFL